MAINVHNPSLLYRHIFASDDEPGLLLQFLHGVMASYTLRNMRTGKLYDWHDYELIQKMDHARLTIEYILIFDGKEIRIREAYKQEIALYNLTRDHNDLSTG